MGMKKENNGRTSVLPVILCVAALVLIIAYAFGTIGKDGASKTQTAVHEDDGFWKTKEQLENDKNITLYMQEAVLGSSERTKKLEVFVQEVSDVTKLEDKGILPFDLDKKTMYIKYSGTATYTVDLSQLTDADVTVNQGNKIVTICIPHVEEKLELNTDETQAQETQHDGIFSLGDLKVKPESMIKAQQDVTKNMKEKLSKEKTKDNADKMAVMSVWEIYQPIIQQIDSSYAVNVEFAD
jgi:hypothetical protein